MVEMLVASKADMLVAQTVLHLVDNLVAQIAGRMGILLVD